MPRTLLLDLDGTLVDSVPDLATALNHVLVAEGHAPLGEAEVARMVGDGVDALLSRGFAARGTAPGARTRAIFTDVYGARAADRTHPYPGVADGLRALEASGWRLAVCTNKPEALAWRVLEGVGLAGHFAAVGGGDSFPVRKPDPGHLLATLDRAGGDRAGAVMVGDHANDVAAAAGAGLPCIFAAWGYGTPGMARGAAATADRFAAVPALLATIGQPPV